ncbi:MAG TPA: carboxypeptidase-like regulatory domain-containing protein [Puia sp.]|nr:carboxypeptidase-like regulatory domain-containing protein [Puia sp.]
MKSSKLILGALLIIVAAGIFSFKAFFSGSVKGTVTPADGATRAWIVSATDTLKSPIANGSFEIPGVKPGMYKVIIEAKPPYKNVSKDGVNVIDGQTSDVGEIKLSQ